jgi:hypothetical protein
MPDLTTVLWIAALGLFVWLLARTKSPPASTAPGSTMTPAEEAAYEAELSHRIGVAVGAAGGDVRDAAEVRYALSRIVPKGQMPTNEQILLAIGAAAGVRQDDD